MKEEIVKCDKCGKDISPKKRLYASASHIEFQLEYWHGGSVGGLEDIDEFKLDLCDDCSRELSCMIQNWIKPKKIKEGGEE